MAHFGLTDYIKSIIVKLQEQDKSNETGLPALQAFMYELASIVSGNSGTATSNRL